MKKILMAIGLSIALPAAAYAQSAPAPAHKMKCCDEKAKADCCKDSKADCCKDMAGMQGMHDMKGMKGMEGMQHGDHAPQADAHQNHQQ
jgi:hypothetical protein